MGARVTILNGSGPSDKDVLQHFFKNLMAPPAQAAEPMGNSIRRLLGATGFGSPQPMQAFAPPPPEAPEMPGVRAPTFDQWADDYLQRANTPAAAAFRKQYPEYAHYMPTTRDSLLGYAQR